jgi:hypothetical protein
MRTYNLIFTKLGPTTRVEACPYRYAWLVGACVGVASTALAVVAIGLMLVLLPGEIAGPSAAASLANFGAVAALLLGVFLTSNCAYAV